MSQYPESLDYMMAAWNEADPSKVRAHLDKALDENVRFVDPSIDLTGIDAFEANVHEVQKSLPEAVYSRACDVDSQHGFHRYHWAIHQDGKLITPGFDVTETNEQGKVTCVMGFFGRISGYAESA